MRFDGVRFTAFSTPRTIKIRQSNGRTFISSETSDGGLLMQAKIVD